MKNRLYLSLILFAPLIASDTYLISNKGLSTFVANPPSGSTPAVLQNYIALYDQEANSSTLIGGYYDQENDNAHCAMGAVKGQSLTLIIPENPQKFGMVSANCNCQSNQNSKACKNQPEGCSVLCGGVVEDGTELQVNGKNVTLHVSPLCQSIGYGIINQFNADNNTDYKVAEYISCNENAQSYCSITFVPKKSFNLQIITDYLGFGAVTPGGCQVSSSGSASCDLMQQDSTLSKCSLDSSGLNTWVNTNLKNILQQQVSAPPLAYFSCNPSPVQLNQALIDKYINSAQEQITTLVTKAYEKNNISYIPVSAVEAITQSKSDTLTLDQQNQLKTFYKNLCPTVSFTIPSDISTPKAFGEFQQKCISSPGASSNMEKLQGVNVPNTVITKLVDNVKNAVAKGLPCVGLATLDTNNDPIVTYTCSTIGFSPEYTCTFIYTVTDKNCASSGNCTMQLSSAYCNVPAELILNTENISCGFIGLAESGTVGKNGVGVSIEASYGDGLYPFATSSSQIQMPDSSNGMITEMVYK
jgi:hypothetical protein